MRSESQFFRQVNDWYNSSIRRSVSARINQLTHYEDLQIIQRSHLGGLKCHDPFANEDPQISVMLIAVRDTDTMITLAP